MEHAFPETPSIQVCVRPSVSESPTMTLSPEIRTDDGKFLLIDFTESRMHGGEKCVAQHVRQQAVHKSLGWL